MKAGQWFWIILLLFVGNVASVVAIVGELSSSSKVDFSFVSNELGRRKTSRRYWRLFNYLQSIGVELFKSFLCFKFTGEIDSFGLVFSINEAKRKDWSIFMIRKKWEIYKNVAVVGVGEKGHCYEEEIAMH